MTATPGGTAPGAATALVVLKAGILVFVGLIRYRSFRASWTTESPELGALAAGFAIVTLGFLLGGFVDQTPNVNLDVGMLIDSTFRWWAFS